MRAKLTSAPGERAALVAAAEEIVREQGRAAATVEAVCVLSGISKAGFRRSFSGRDALLVALHDELAAEAGASMRRAYYRESSWLDGVRAAMTDLLTRFDENPALARFVLVDCAIDESALPSRRAAVIARFASELERDRPTGEATGGGPPFGTPALIGAVVAILHGRLMEDPVPPLRPLAGSLTGMIVMPYLGPDAARAELTREDVAPASARKAPPPALRMTTRTLAVLRAIGGHPGMSNAEVARAAGISDPGQVSKLLARLRSLGLIECDPASRGRPVGKAWQLSGAGRDVLARARRSS